MTPLPDLTWTGAAFPHSATVTFTVEVKDPCIYPTMTAMVAPTIAGNFIQIGDSLKTIATVFFDDTFGTGKPSIDSSCCFCGARTYII
jgi:hypothetical protein